MLIFPARRFCAAATVVMPRFRAALASASVEHDFSMPSRNIAYEQFPADSGRNCSDKRDHLFEMVEILPMNDEIYRKRDM